MMRRAPRQPKWRLRSFRSDRVSGERGDSFCGVETVALDARLPAVSHLTDHARTPLTLLKTFSPQAPGSASSPSFVTGGFCSAGLCHVRRACRRAARRRPPWPPRGRAAFPGTRYVRAPHPSLVIPWTRASGTRASTFDSRREHIHGPPVDAGDFAGKHCGAGDAPVSTRRAPAAPLLQPPLLLDIS